MNFGGPQIISHQPCCWLEALIRKLFWNLTWHIDIRSGANDATRAANKQYALQKSCYCPINWRFNKFNSDKIKNQLKVHTKHESARRERRQYRFFNPYKKMSQAPPPLFVGIPSGLIVRLQEAITRSVQLPQIPVTAFWRIGLFLVWITANSDSCRNSSGQVRAPT